MPPPLPSRTRLWKDKHELSIHQAVSETPEDQALVARLVSDWTARIAAGEDPHGLIRETIKINATDEIGDGRHRELAALRVPQITQVECEILAESEFADLIMEMLLQRRHYSKSARAYALRHMAAKAAKAGAEARIGKARAANPKVDSSVSRSNRPTEITLESLALKSDLSTDLLGQAVKLEAWYMPKADQLVADWLQLHPDENEMWLAWQETHPYAAMPWTAWRMQRLAEMGVADDAASVHSIPRHWREIEEDKIFNGIHDPSGEDCDRLSYSLGSALKAMGSYFATAGKPRPDISHENPALHLTLVNKVTSFSKTMWANWSDIEPPARMEVLKKLTTAIVGGTDEHGKPVDPWPEDARQAVLVALSKR
jgi:lambda repressor-like predicted transcriptional regulator